MKKWEHFTDKELEVFVKRSKSIRELARNLGYNSNAGEIERTMREMIKIKNLDISHFIDA